MFSSYQHVNLDILRFAHCFLAVFLCTAKFLCFPWFVRTFQYFNTNKVILIYFDPTWMKLSYKLRLLLWVLGEELFSFDMSIRYNYIKKVMKREKFHSLYHGIWFGAYWLAIPFVPTSHEGIIIRNTHGLWNIYFIMFMSTSCHLSTFPYFVMALTPDGLKSFYIICSI